MNRKYMCVIWSNSSLSRKYEVTTRSAMKCALEYGRAEGGEVVQVQSKSGKVISAVAWNPEYRNYCRQCI